MIIPLLLFISVATFQNLSSFTDKECEISGFLYRADDGRVILSETPNLKSCCVGSKAKAKEQVVCIGQLDVLPTTLSTLRGVLSLKDQTFVLEDAHIALSNKIPWKTLTFASLLILTFVLFQRKDAKVQRRKGK